MCDLSSLHFLLQNEERLYEMNIDQPTICMHSVIPQHGHFRFPYTAPCDPTYNVSYRIKTFGGDHLALIW